jgi:hypothetical protein
VSREERYPKAVRFLSSVRSLSVPVLAAAGLATVTMNIAFVRAQRATSTEPRPQPAIPAIIDTLKAYRLVAIGEATEVSSSTTSSSRFCKTRAFCQAAGISWSSSAMRGTKV